VIDIRVFTGGGFAENAYLVQCRETGAAVVVDPGAAAPAMADAIRSESLAVEAILLTHAHLDHVEGVHEIRAVAPEAPIWIHPGALPMYRSLPQQAAWFGMRMAPQPEPDREFVHGQDFTFGGCTLDVRDAPGHAPGHVILVSHEDRAVLVGDVVFQGSIGRVDLPGGDMRTLMKSIREQVLTLPDDFVLYPGHGPPTTVGFERVGNPFLVGVYGGELA